MIGRSAVALGIPQRRQPGQSLQENILEQVLRSDPWNPCQENSMHHSNVTLIKMAESGAIAALGSPDQRLVTDVSAGSRVHR